MFISYFSILDLFLNLFLPERFLRPQYPTLEFEGFRHSLLQQICARARFCFAILEIASLFANHLLQLQEQQLPRQLK